MKDQGDEIFDVKLLVYNFWFLLGSNYHDFNKQTVEG